MNSKHPILSSLNTKLAHTLSTCAKLCRRLGQGVADYVLVSGQMPSPVRAPEIAAFTELAKERAKRRSIPSPSPSAVTDKGSPTAALLASASWPL